VRNSLWTVARAVPSLDLRFAENKSLVDATTGAQLVTFTRASSGTFVGSDGLIQTAVTNLMVRSEEFDQTWSLLNSSSITADQGIAPNGTNTADLYTEAASGFSSITQSRTLANAATYTASVYLKKGTSDWARVIVEDVNTSDFFAVYYDINTGQVGGNAAAGTGLFSSASIIAVGSGWYRVVLTGVPGGSSGTVRVRIHSAQGNNNSTRNFNSTTLLWGAQLEQSSTVGEYIPTTSTINSAPRFDHNPTTGESLGLLVEEQRTNSIRNNTMVGAVAGTPGTPPTNWTLGIASSMALNIIGTGTENGVSYIDVQYTGTASGTTSSSVAFETNTGIAGATGQTWTASAYIKVVGGSTTGISLIRLGWEERSGSFVTAKNSSGLTLATSGNLITTRQAHTATNDGGATIAYVKPYVILTPNNGAAIDITLRIGLPQLEQGAFATSVIPTTTAAVTRSADVASITGSAFSSWYRQDEGTVFTEYRDPGVAGNNRYPCITSDGTINNRIGFFVSSTTTINNRHVAGSTFSNPGALNTVLNIRNRHAIAAAVGSCNAASNGTLATASAPAAMPVVNQLNIGSLSGTEFLNAPIVRICFWPTRLPNPTLQAVTQ
jgi:hypothetical protein